MILTFQLGERSYRADSAQPLSIAIALHFNGPQPRHFGVPPASAESYEGDGFIGDTRRGGSCNVPVIRLNPHCNGTHTESVGHILDQFAPVHEALRASLMPACLLTIAPQPALASDDDYRPAKAEGDLLITRAALQAALEGQPAQLEALVIRTTPNGEDKLSRDYGPPQFPPFLSVDAIDFLVARGIQHLLVDFPSVDKMYDKGKLTVHHRFWNVPEGSHQRQPDTRTLQTITEMVYVPDFITDGLYLLNLQIAPFMLDVAPSRPILFSLEPQ